MDVVVDALEAREGTGPGAAAPGAIGEVVEVSVGEEEEGYLLPEGGVFVVELLLDEGVAGGAAGVRVAEGSGAVLPLNWVLDVSSEGVPGRRWERGEGCARWEGEHRTPLVRSPLSGLTWEMLNENKGFSIDLRCPSVSTTRIIWFAMDGGSESAPARTRAAQSKYGRRTSFAASTYRARRFCGNFWATSWMAE